VPTCDDMLRTMECLMTDGVGTGQLMTWGVAIRMEMRHERQKQYILPDKDGESGKMEYNGNSS